MKIGNKDFLLGERTYIMGILNITPDSFSDGGRFNEVKSALERVEVMINEGADIIDVGGESTRPNFKEVNVNNEIERVVPIIKGIKEKFDIPVSIDTYKKETAEAAIKAGADIINDIWGFKKDKGMAKIAALHNVPCILMHNSIEGKYNNLIEDIIKDLEESINIAISNGVKKENIILDPGIGIGFAKTYEENLFIINNLEKFKALGYPLLLGTSRKSVIGITLDTDVNERIEGTIATTVMGIMKGCSFVRVHDVLQNKRAALMTDKIVNAK